MCGVKTNIVTAVEIEGKHASDVKFFAPLVEATAQNFQIWQVSADKAYGSLASTDAVHKVGGTPFISFKGNATGKVGGIYQKMFHYFMFRKQEFLQHYHKRSNVESTFSMMKRKFGDSLRSKTDAAMVNETLCKVLCHNLVVLIHEMYELGIDPAFWNAPSSIDDGALPILVTMRNTKPQPLKDGQNGGPIMTKILISPGASGAIG